MPVTLYKRGTLTIGGDAHEYDLLYFGFEAHKKLDKNGNVNSPMQWPFVYVELLFTRQDIFLNWANSTKEPETIRINLLPDAGQYGSPKLVELKNAYCICYEEKYKSELLYSPTGTRRGSRIYNFIICLTITAGEIKINNAQLRNF